jgi:hypothetical protein
MNAMRLLSIIFFTLSSLLVSQFSMADSPTNFDKDKLAIAKQIWEPIFSVTQKDTNLQVSHEQFLKINNLYYEAYAEFLNNEELTVVKKMYATSVGNKIAVNMARSLFQLEPFTLTYEDLSSKEKAEWEIFSKENYNQIKSLEEKMKGFIPFLKNKYAKK